MYSVDSIVCMIHSLSGHLPDENASVKAQVDSLNSVSVTSSLFSATLLLHKWLKFPHLFTRIILLCFQSVLRSMMKTREDCRNFWNRTHN